MENVLEPAMTVRDVAALLNVDEKTIYRLVTKGEIPGFKVLGSWRFQRHDPGCERVALAETSIDARQLGDSQIRPRPPA